MDLFNSLDNRYYRIFHSLLEQAHEKPLRRAEIVATINRMGFAESTVCLADRLLDPNNPDALGVLQKDGPCYRSILSAPPIIGRDLLELRWLKAILQEERSRMFLTPTLMAEMEALLEDIDPLFPAVTFEAVDVAEDADPYGSEAYAETFRILLEAIRRKRLVKIAYESPKGGRLVGNFAPYRFDYSPKDDKFRLLATFLVRRRVRSYTLNLSRIVSAEIIDAPWPTFLQPKDRPEQIQTAELEITNIRNGFERCFIQLSIYDQESEFDEETGKCHMRLRYALEEESELVITLLSFGPAVKVLGPERLRGEIVQRIQKQMMLMYPTEGDPSATENTSESGDAHE